MRVPLAGVVAGLLLVGLAMTEATERAFGRELDLIREEAERADQRADAA